MKMTRLTWKMLLVIAAPLLLFGFCTPEVEEELPIPNTDEYFTYRMPENNGNLGTPDSVIFARFSSTNVIVSYNHPNTVNTYISFVGPAASGNYDASYVSIFVQGKYYVSTSQPVKVQIDNFGGTGQHIIGSYTGTLKDSTNSTTLTVTGNFKVRNE